MRAGFIFAGFLALSCTDASSSVAELGPGPEIGPGPARAGAESGAGGAVAVIPPPVRSASDAAFDAPSDASRDGPGLNDDPGPDAEAGLGPEARAETGAGGVTSTGGVTAAGGTVTGAGGSVGAGGVDWGPLPCPIGYTHDCSTPACPGYSTCVRPGVWGPCVHGSGCT